MRHLRPLLAVIPFVFLAACSSSQTSTDGGGPTTDAGRTDAGEGDAGPSSTEACLWAPLKCQSTPSGCSCVRACGGHVYEMDCASAGTCVCDTDGAQTGSAAATCGDWFTERIAFSSDAGCLYPGAAPLSRDAGFVSCETANPVVVSTPGGCLYAKNCIGNDYALFCPAGYGCYCAENGVWTSDATADCSNGNSLGDAYANQCGYPVDAGVPAGPPPPACDGGTSCNTVTLETSAPVVIQYGAGGPGMMTGGTPAAGVYYLASVTDFNGLGGNGGMQQEVIRFSAVSSTSATLDIANDGASYLGGGGPLTDGGCFATSTYAVTFNGTGFWANLSCPSCIIGCGENTATYTATGGVTPTFVLVGIDSSGNQVEQQFVWQHN